MAMSGLAGRARHIAVEPFEDRDLSGVIGVMLRQPVQHGAVGDARA